MYKTKKNAPHACSVLCGYGDISYETRAIPCGTREFPIKCVKKPKMCAKEDKTQPRRSSRAANLKSKLPKINRVACYKRYARKIRRCAREKNPKNSALSIPPSNRPKNRAIKALSASPGALYISLNPAGSCTVPAVEPPERMAWRCPLQHGSYSGRRTRLSPAGSCTAPAL